MTAEKIQKIRNRLADGVTAQGLTERQADVLSYILQCWMSGFIPTHREICTEFGWSSPMASVTHCTALERKGFLEAEDAKSGVILSDRAIELALKP